MVIGINENIDEEILLYYEAHYDLLRTPDDNPESRLLNPSKKIKPIGDSINKKCRFCGKTKKETRFKKIAHAFPDSIGNSVLISNIECDNCNQFFGNSIENEYANFFSLYHSIMQIDGKSGVPKCGYKISCSKRTKSCAKNCVEIHFGQEYPSMRICEEVPTDYIEMSNTSLTISRPLGRCCPIAVFKTIVKMAITVMPPEEVPLFSKTVQWLLAPQHQNIDSNRKLLVRYKMIPGFNVTKYPHYALYRRKHYIECEPYMLFNLTYGCFSLLVEIPNDYDNGSNNRFTQIPFPLIPFHTSSEDTWNLSGTESPLNMKHSITIDAMSVTNCKNNFVIDDKGNTIPNPALKI